MQKSELQGVLLLTPPVSICAQHGKFVTLLQVLLAQHLKLRFERCLLSLG
jgi:hypothetical protein